MATLPLLESAVSYALIHSYCLFLLFDWLRLWIKCQICHKGNKLYVVVLQIYVAIRSKYLGINALYAYNTSNRANIMWASSVEKKLKEVELHHLVHVISRNSTIIFCQQVYFIDP